MGWSWNVTRYYGILINARKTGKYVLKVLNEKYGLEYTQLNYSHDVILWYKKIYIDSDNGSYSGGRLDTAGSLFKEPKHPTYFKYVGEIEDSNGLDPQMVEDVKKLCNFETGYMNFSKDFSILELAEVN